MKRLSVTIPIGIPGSGKSTHAAKLARRDPSTCIVNPDSIRGELYNYGKPGVKFDPAMDEKAWSIAKSRAMSCVANKRNVFIDATNPDRFGRASIIKWFDESDYDIKAVRFAMEPGLAILRNEKRGKQDVPSRVICEKLVSLKEPAKWEGFTSIKYVGMPPTKEETHEMTRGKDKYDCVKILSSPK